MIWQTKNQSCGLGKQKHMWILIATKNPLFHIRAFEFKLTNLTNNPVKNSVCYMAINPGIAVAHHLPSPNPSYSKLFMGSNFVDYFVIGNVKIR